MSDYDVIMAGGGLAGTITAQSIAHYSNQNLRILVIDRNPEFMPGRKSLAGWVCVRRMFQRSCRFYVK